MTTYGTTALKMSPIVTCDGATPFMVIALRDKNGTALDGAIRASAEPHTGCLTNVLSIRSLTR